MSGDSPAWVNLHELAQAAGPKLSAQAAAYFNGGAADEHTLAANPADWQRLHLWPRTLAPLGGSHTRTLIGPHAVAHPIWLAPVAYQQLAHPEGEVATAMAAAAQGAGMVLSSQSSVAVEDVANAMRTVAEPAGDVPPLWFQLYWQPDRALTLNLIQRAEAAGCSALVLTVDAPVHGVRDRERRAGFSLPTGVRAVHLPHGVARASTLTPLLQAAPTWHDLNWLREHTRLPIWLKGVLHPADAALARTAGMDGLIVSNHGGRTLDTCVSTAWALPRVADAVQGELPLLVDGGIRRGTDVLKAVALGAQGVLIGRPQVHALACGGALGVARMIRLLRDELAVAMALCGCSDLRHATRDLLA